VKPETQL